MESNQIIKLLRKQIQSLGLIDVKYLSDEKFAKWYGKTKLYIVQGFSNQGKDYKKNVYLEMFEEKVCLIPDNETDTKPLTVRQAKNQIQDVLRNFIEILAEFNVNKGSSVSKTKIEVNNSLQSIQTVSIKQAMKNIMNEIKKTETNNEKIAEADNKLNILEGEIKKGNKGNRETIKDIFKWLADLGKDVLLAALPIILKHYGI